ncbi:MAG: hypothetical protein M1834_002889 [Cirrosporium novae-zelandiae]|nr:MAG: hypothetical protein M1834_002889 [Cirrosporium novae-zelandiae]
MYIYWRLWVAIFFSFYFIPVQASSKVPNPLNYISLLEKPEIRTPSHRLHAFSEFDLIFNLHRNAQRIKLKLEPNHDILADDATVHFLDQNGDVQYSEPIERLAHRVFKGYASVQGYDGDWTRVGSARITIVRDGLHPLFEGSFEIRGDYHSIKTLSNYRRSKHPLDPDPVGVDEESMVVFRDSDHDSNSGYQTELRRRASEIEQLCGADTLDFNLQPDHPVYSGFGPKSDVSFWGSISAGSIFGKRQIDSSTGSGNSAGVNLTSTIGSTSGCPNTRKVALVGVATDCMYTASMNSTETTRQTVISMINSASDVFEKSFNITLGLRNLTVSDASCPGTASTTTAWNVNCAGANITERLDLFSRWRGTHADSNAFWTLLSTCNTGADVGLSWLGQLCVSSVTNDTSGNSATGANVVVPVDSGWEVFAHEAGHIFGAVHDCTSTTCSDGTASKQQCCPLSSSTCNANAQYIMNPSAVDSVTSFSPCTIGNICSGMLRNSINSDCLSDNKGITTITGQQCGNGIVEDGEDCDCGGTESCGDNSCCNPTTCKFKDSAVCDDSNDACCSSCQFASKGTICRESTGKCDPEETCSGTNATCPADQTAADGKSCGDSLTCASGQCTSRDLQCKTLTGQLGVGNDTYACDSYSCTITCASPELGSNACYEMQQNFLDGTSCGGGGKCENGVCKGSSATKEIGSWISDHKGLVIGLSAGLGAVILLLVLGCIYRSCVARRNRKRFRKPMIPPQMQGWGHPMQAYPPPPPPPRHMRSRSRGGNNSGWDPNGYQRGPPPPYYGGQSVRYA